MKLDNTCEYCGSPLEQYYSVTTAANLLDCSEQFFRNLMRDRKIDYVKFGRLVRIPESAIVEIANAIRQISRKN